MQKIIQDNGDGFIGIAGWFDPDKATMFGDGSDRDERNWTNIYHTASGRYVLNQEDRYEGNSGTYELMSDKDVALWIIRHNRGDVPTTPEIDKIIADMEV